MPYNKTLQQKQFLLFEVLQVYYYFLNPREDLVAIFRPVAYPTNIMVTAIKNIGVCCFSSLVWLSFDVPLGTDHGINLIWSFSLGSYGLRAAWLCLLSSFPVTFELGPFQPDLIDGERLQRQFSVNSLTAGAA